MTAPPIPARSARLVLVTPDGRAVGALDRVPADAVDAVRAHWHAQWTDAIPGSEPDRASHLLRPVAVARQAVIYQTFLDGIEPSERPYHAADPADWLKRAAEPVRSGDDRDR